MSDLTMTARSSASVSATLRGALAWLARTWISERLRAAIQAAYATRIETLGVHLRADHRRSMKGDINEPRPQAHAH
ncbi:hypothetical protein B0G75_12056 [Paraburkholderia sp. BL18I3N2]|uniref:CRISPR-associated protein Cas5 n=1 Tax=unclassified Paraburkholderia TaxID=2615204 RepID=UPI000D07019B|nr:MULTISPECIES: CRISPR-associated protein Cas5 [unclassified Paraburkholderia]PRX26099.1 hypothetical protein B0G75_12056 [Paraburkholderia sp. BL18I3N2]PRX95324.1 hypothetical protein B0G73_13317 [Paraburkholderia sp. BL25I1N1]